MRRFFEGTYTSTLVVKLPNGWYVSKSIKYLGSQVSTHAVIVEDPYHDIEPSLFALPTEGEQ